MKLTILYHIVQKGGEKSILAREFDELYSLLYLPSIKSTSEKIQLTFEKDNKELLFEFGRHDRSEAILQEKENCFYEVIGNTIHYVYNSCLITYKDKVIETIEGIKKLLIMIKLKILF